MAARGAGLQRVWQSDFKRHISVVLNNSVGRCGALMPVLKIETVVQDLAEWIGGRKKDTRSVRESRT